MFDFLLYGVEKLLRVASETIHNLRLSQRKKISERLKGKKIKLDLGSGGKKKAGFIGIDVVLGPKVDIEHNLEYGIPFPDNSISEIYSSHFLEHLPDRKVPYSLKECFRALIPGGKITIEVPNLEATLKGFLKMNEKEKWQAGWEWIFGNQKKKFEFHKTGFTKKRLVSLLEDVGFEKIKVSEYKHGTIPSLRAQAVKGKT